jgi:hypothetical protein
MRRIWEQMNPKRVAHRDSHGRFHKAQSGPVRRPLTVAQKAANYVLNCLHSGKDHDLDKWHAARAGRILKQRRERDLMNHLRRIGAV